MNNSTSPRVRKLARERIPSGCSIAGIMDVNGVVIPGSEIVGLIEVMHDRSNGLGGGFAGYGIYPRHANDYCFHLMYDYSEAKQQTENAMEKCFEIVGEEEIPTTPVKEVVKRPILWRYFLRICPETRERYYEMSDDDIVMMVVMEINEFIEGAFVVSSGKNMGVFKGVGYPEQIARFYRVEEYGAHIWIAHGRFPTNTPGWWGGAHPFGLLDWAMVHNGEISSYGTNKRYLEEFGYRLMLQTDSEAILYLFDLLARRHGLPLDIACAALAPPLWERIAEMTPHEKNFYRTLRIVYGSAMINGPSALILAHPRGMVGLTDRIKLRPLIAAVAGSRRFLASEECAIRAVCPEPERVWSPAAGEPTVFTMEQG
ncbi:MAG: glutamine amidotransferase family protein [Candidatus Aureabacteria bacterium]|nr:glutamine amidotransferase family protein [Candidatus Auribacterota bacterium]